MKFLPVPNIFEYLSQLLGSKTKVMTKNEYPVVFERTRKVFRLFEILKQKVVSKIQSVKQNPVWQQAQIINSSSEGQSSVFYRLLIP